VKRDDVRIRGDSIVVRTGNQTVIYVSDGRIMTEAETDQPT
jgi:hypothetical protein